MPFSIELIILWYSVTQVVWHKVLFTYIWGVPPAGGPLL